MKQVNDQIKEAVERLKEETTEANNLNLPLGSHTSAKQREQASDAAAEHQAQIESKTSLKADTSAKEVGKEEKSEEEVDI